MLRQDLARFVGCTLRAVIILFVLQLFRGIAEGQRRHSRKQRRALRPELSDRSPLREFGRGYI